MPAPSALSRAADVATWLNQKLHDLPVPATLRNRMAGACFAVAQEHQQAIVILLQQSHPLHATAFALVRPVFEAYVRGMWLSHCATEAKVEEFSNGAKPPDTASLVKAIEMAVDVDNKLLSNIYMHNWSSLCSYTHTGSHQVQRWNTSEAIEPRYDINEINEVLNFTSAIALLSAFGLAALADDVLLSKELLVKVNEHVNHVL